MSLHRQSQLSVSCAETLFLACHRLHADLCQSLLALCILSFSVFLSCTSHYEPAYFLNYPRFPFLDFFLRVYGHNNSISLLLVPTTYDLKFKLYCRYLCTEKPIMYF